MVRTAYYVHTVMTGQHTTSVTLKQKQPLTHTSQRMNTIMYVCMYVCMYIYVYTYKCHFSWEKVVCRQTGSSPISQMCDILIKTWWGVAFGLCEVRMENIPLQACHVQTLFNKVDMYSPPASVSSPDEISTSLEASFTKSSISPSNGSRKDEGTHPTLLSTTASHQPTYSTYAYSKATISIKRSHVPYKVL